MQKLRKAHLYLGCLFAPMIVFFAVSGLWQSFFLHYPKEGDSKTLALVSTIHTGRSLKMAAPSTLSSPWLHWFVVAMAAGLVLTTILGVIMAFKFGKGRAAFWSLLAGMAIPALLICLKLWI